MTGYLRGAAAAAVLVLILAGVPVLLTSLLGNPLQGWASLVAGDVSDDVVLDVLAAVAWAAWAAFTWAVAGEVLTLLRAVPGPLPATVPALGHLAHVLVLAAVLIPATAAISAGAGRGIGAAAGHHWGPPLSGSELHVALASSSSPAQGANATGDQVAPVRLQEYLIGAHDPRTWWDLAAQHLGDGARWRELWDLNVGRRQVDGSVLTSPRFLRPGWNVLLPVPPAPPLGQPVAGTPDQAGAVPREPETTAAAPASAMEPHSSQLGPAAVPFGAGAGGGLLAAVIVAQLAAARRRRSCHRRPGRVIASTASTHAPVEKALVDATTRDPVDLTWVDTALRALGEQLGRGAGRLPELVAARVSIEVLQLVLATDGRPNEVELPAPWAQDPGTGRWQLRRQLGPGAVLLTPGPARDPSPASASPWPALVSLGRDASGDHWLLNLQQAGTVILDGDPDRGRDLLRAMAVELALNSWSRTLRVSVRGLGAEFAPLGHPRLVHEDLDVEVDDSAGKGESSGDHDGRDAVNATDPAQVGSDTSHRHRRGTPARPDLRPGSELVVTPATTGRPAAQGPHTDVVEVPQAAAGRLNSASAANRLARVVVSGTGGDDFPGIGPAAAGLGDTAAPGSPPLPPAGLHIRISAQARAWFDVIGAEIALQQLPAQDAGELAALLLAARATDDEAMPSGSPEDGQPAVWDAAGTLLTDPPLGPGDGSHEPNRGRHGDQGLPDPGDGADRDAPPGPRLISVLSSTASTARDLAVLAPVVSSKVRASIAGSDPDLDADLAQWHSHSCRRARLSVLGPVRVRASGPLPQGRPRVPWNTEIVTFLSAHPQGVTAEHLGSALWPNDPDIAGKSTPRQAMHILRQWLGPHAPGGGDHVPPATEQHFGGPKLFRIEGLLSDADLFARLRRRAAGSGEEGLDDLQAALDLVTGRILDQRRPAGYLWLIDVPLQAQYEAMVVDVAHLVATIHLSHDRPAEAEVAARVALTAAGEQDITLLDLVEASQAQGHEGEAASWVQRILSVNDAETEDDLPPRTARILARRHWLERAG